MNNKVLVVCSSNKGNISSFVKEQVGSLLSHGYQFDFFLIRDKGIIGYLKSIFRYYFYINNNHKSFKFVHAHYGFSGLLAVFQNKLPVIVTFHGTDISNKKARILSFIASRFSSCNIFVHPDQPKKLYLDKTDSNIIPCGVDLNVFFPVEKKTARRKLNMNLDEKYILFSGAFNNKIKNYNLAKEAIEMLPFEVNLIELKGYSRENVNYLMNAVDCLLVTSFSETGPLVVKEAMATNTPFVSTDVGDVKNISRNVEGCFIAKYNPKNISSLLLKAITIKMEGGREKINMMGLDLENVANRISIIYDSCLDMKNSKKK